MKIKRRELCTAAALAACLAAGGCSMEEAGSYLSAEGLKEKLFSQEEQEQESEILSEEDGAVAEPGDTVRVEEQMDSGVEKWDCVVESAELFSSVSDAGLDPAWLLEQAEVSDGDGSKLVTPEDYDSYQLVFCSVKVKNIQMDEDFNITALDLASVSDAGEIRHSVSYPVYFVCDTRSTESGGEWHCQIPAEEEKELQIGWLVDPSVSPAGSLYLQIPYGMEGTYVDLGL